MREATCNLSDCFLCRNTVPEWKELIAIKKKTLLFRKGKAIFHEGEEVTGIYFLYSGSVKLHQQWTDDKELIIRFAKAGDVIGHRGFGEPVYPVSATAMEDSKLCFISYEFLETSLKAGQQLTYCMMRFYAAELQHAEKRMRHLAHMEVKGRISDALIEIHELFGVDDENYIAETLTRQDIASYAGTTYETVFKFFNELLKEDVITTSGKRIRINDREKLNSYISSNGV
jgi:CRP-like cAMP-binding protein